MNYKLIADSSCEFTDDLKKYFNPSSVPLSMTVGDETFVDDESLDIEGFVEKLNIDKSKAKSACPAPIIYTENCENDKTNFIITLSSKLSGSYQSACLGAENASKEGKETYVFDSKSASAGEVLVSIKIKEFIENGFSKEEIIDKTHHFIDNMKTLFSLENLEVFIKSGRVNKLVGRLATVMNIRPILGSDGDGNISFFSKARGTHNAIEKLSNLIGDQKEITNKDTLVISHCQNTEGAKFLESLISSKYNFKEIITVKTRGLSSMYANRGGIIIAF